ncbi:MAG: hypothetical protein GY953_56115 [bacterium]|nr:hypothetical protein [bacterium]
MLISANHKQWDAQNEQGVEHALSTRDARGGGEFWLAEGIGEYPCLGSIVSGEQSNIHYFPEKGHPGFRCLGGKGLPPEGTSIFVFDAGDPGDGIEVPNDFVVPVATAVVVAKEFLRCRNLPTSVEWLEL